MDPLTAFSLACGVIQVIDFSTRVAKKCRELYKDGTLSQNTEAEDMATELTQLRTSLNLPKHRDHDDLLKLGEKCSAIAEDLIAELQKLKVSGPHRKRQAIEKTFKTIWKKTAIDDIQKRLDDCRKILDHRVLIDLRKRSDLMSIQQDEGFQSLDLKVQMLITNLAQGPKTFEELKALIQDETRSVKNHVTNEFQQHQRDLAHKEYCQRFLDSLWFREIHRRQETINEAHEKTFQWIYEPDQFDKTVRGWDNFVDWLKSGQGTYWINGKAGSGKSTLMNFIYQDDRTAASLRVWSGSMEIFTPGFFFWSAGETLEKSSEGLLRSLIYQILKRFPSLTPSSQIGASSESMQNRSWGYEPIAAWTERRLHATFESVLRQAQEMCRICVFIDGLDEFSGDQDVLMRLIGKVQRADVKVCLSSRPYRSYSEAFGSSAKLQLQDLTKSDIKKYVSDKLHPLVKANPTRDIYYAFDTVVDKAEGVFLWVELVVKDLIKGLKNDDTLEQLQERLELMPSDIEDLYAHMLSKIDRVYQTQAAKLFQMALTDRSESLFILALAIFGRSSEVSDIGLSDIISYSEEAKKKIPTVCAGLLEVHLSGRRRMNPRDISGGRVRGGTFRNADPSLSLVLPYAKSSELAEVTFLQKHTHVEFIHRTARDYLEQSEKGKQFLCANSPPNFNPYISHVNALLTKAALLGFSFISPDQSPDLYFFIKYPPNHIYDDQDQDHSASELVYDIMAYVNLGERHLKTAQVLLCDDIICTLMAIDYWHGLLFPKVLREIMENISVAERQNGTAQVSICAEYDEILADMNRQSSPKAHWSVRWGFCSQHYVMGGGEMTPFSSSSRSISTDSLNCANTEPRLLENPSVLPTRPVDFVGFAALWGLSHYVEQKLGCESKTVDQDSADYLLCCSMWAFRDTSACMGSDRPSKSCALTAEILRLGGDCNIYVKDFSNTLWGGFLTQLTWNLTPGRSDDKVACAMTTKAFLENGADVQARTHREVTVRLSGLGSLVFTCREENTALCAIQEHFGDLPEFESLKNQILNKGGSSSSRWTHIALNWSSAGEVYDVNDLRPYKISEQQSHDLKAAFRGYGAKDDEKDDSMQIRQTWAHEIARLYREIRGDNGDTDNLYPSNEEVLPDVNVEDSSNEEVLPDFDWEVRSNEEVLSDFDVEESSRVQAQLNFRAANHTLIGSWKKDDLLLLASISQV